MTIGFNLKKWLLVAAASVFISSGLTGYAPSIANAQSATFFTWPSSPSGTVGISRPAIEMKVRFTGLEMASYQMTLNGASVPAVYDAATERFSYTPAANLAPGSYSVVLTLQFQGFNAKKYTWNFTVAPNAITPSTDTNAGQLEALQAVNQIRKSLGLSSVTLNPNLNASALAHAHYQNILGTITHNETPGNEGYTGQTLAQRIAYFGYANDSAAEDISQQANSTASQAVSDLFDAPYHRIPFLDPGLKEIGYGKEGSFHVILFGMQEDRSADPQIVTTPVGSGIKVGWNGHEIPDPLRVHPGTAYPVGYPIMVGAYASDITKVDLSSAHLTDASGAEVPLLTNTPANDDHLTNEVILIPAKPLNPGTRYHASVSLTVSGQQRAAQQLNKEWDFVTAGPTGQQQLPVSAGNTSGASSDTSLNKVTFGLDGSTFTIGRLSYQMAAKPLLLNGFSYLALRDLEKALGATVEWDDSAKAAIYKKNNRTVVFYVNSGNVELNGVSYKTDTPAFLTGINTDNPRTMVPVRLLSNLLGCGVDYNNDTRTVTITY